MNYKQIGNAIKTQIKEQTGYDYDVLIITIDHMNPNYRLLIHSEDERIEQYKEESINLFTKIINSATEYRWTRLVGESNWLLVKNN